MKSLEPANTVVTIIGQGYVGLPLAQAIVDSGFRVHGLEVSQRRVDALNAGLSHVDDISDSELQSMLSSGYSATTDPAVLRSSDFVLICVPTPLDSNGGPDLGAVEEATRTIATNFKHGSCVVLESTTYPGTTQEIVLPLLENSGAVQGKDFFLAFSPERVDPGSKHYDIRNTPKLVGGVTPSSTRVAAEFYAHFIDTVVPLSGAKEAETAKLLENTYRHVNIALVNEMAKFCYDMDIDIWEVIRGASTKPFGFQRFTPGPGVGGHCIPIDPNYLGFQVKKTLGYQFKFVELAQEINNSMPAYVVERVADLLNDSGKALNGSSVLLLGITYKANIADQRETPALPIAEILHKKKARVSFHDPLVEDWQIGDSTLRRVSDLRTAVESADVVVLLQDHKFYTESNLADKAQVFFDTRGSGHGIPGVVTL